MYARIMRRWSLKTQLMKQLMSLLLFVFYCVSSSMLLPSVCATPTATLTQAAAGAGDAAKLSHTQQLAAARAHYSLAQSDISSSSSSSLSSLKRQMTYGNVVVAAAATAAALNVGNAGADADDVEGNYYIPVYSAGSSRSRNSNNFFANRLFKSQPSSSSSISSSNIKLTSLSNKQEQQQDQQQQPQAAATAYDDSLVYSYYYKPTTAVQQQPWQPADDANSNITDEEYEKYNRAANILDKKEGGEEEEYEDEDEDEDEYGKHQQPEPVASPASSLTQKVPNTLINSQIFNLLNYKNNNNNNNNNNINKLAGSSNKARRHVSQQLQQPPPQPQGNNHHSPVRETGNKTTKAATVAAKQPFHYLIESYEVPVSPNDLSLEQQAARSRRDSRLFGAFIAGGVAVTPSPTTTTTIVANNNYYNQQFQRLQQQQPQHHHNNQHHQHHHQHQQHHHQHQRSQHHQRQRQQHQRNRKHTRRYCSARDPAQLAFEAPTVFEGKIISMTPDRRINFSATVEVKEIFKQQIGYRLQKYLRLQFAYRNTSAECDIYREQLRPRGLVRGDELEQGRIYLMFVQQIDLGNFTILGQPIRKTRRVIDAVKMAVSENYAQLASIRNITASNRTVENGKELRIVCKVQGRPPPKVTWFKDHKSINRNRNLYQFVHYKKRSELIIRSFNSSDAGLYECRAKNKVNQNIQRRAIVIKAYPVPRQDTSTSYGYDCPDDVGFCFNGGTCNFSSEIGFYWCICPEGFMGERCDRKEVTNMPPSSTFKTGYIADDPAAYASGTVPEADQPCIVLDTKKHSKQRRNLC